MQKVGVAATAQEMSMRKCQELKVVGKNDDIRIAPPSSNDVISRYKREGLRRNTGIPTVNTDLTNVAP